MNPEAIDTLPVDVRPAPIDEYGLVERQGSGAMALAMLTDKDFEQRLDMLKRGIERIQRVQRELMTEDEDFGVIPGTKKPTLLKPGAEKLCQIYKLVPTFVAQVTEGDGESHPHLRIRTICNLHFGTADGPTVGEGVGAANTWERRYRYRGGERACPSCGVLGSIRRTKFADKQTGEKGWYCNERVGGCGAQFAATDTQITEQQVGQIENPDPYDLENTILKMSAKRSQVDAVLRYTATSGLFTQDLEDLGGGGNDDPPHPAEPQRKSATGARPAVQRSQGNPTEPAPVAKPPEAEATEQILDVRKIEKAGQTPYWIVRTSRHAGAGTRDAALAAACERAWKAKTALQIRIEPGKEGYLPKVVEISPAAPQAAP